MSNDYDIKVNGVRLYFLPVRMRVPLKFGQEIVTEISCTRAAMRIENRAGRTSWGWGEVPLAVRWFWKSSIPFAERLESTEGFTAAVARAWQDFKVQGHPLQIGHAFQQDILPALLATHNKKRQGKDPPGESMPWLAALACCSAFDTALHDAYGMLHNISPYNSYREPFMARDLSTYLKAAEGTEIGFHGFFPNDFLINPPPSRIPAWHLVGERDLLSEAELTGTEPQDGYPVLLEDWIERDGLTCLKVKVRGNDLQWDYQRLVQVGEIAARTGVLWLTAHFNCIVEDPVYVNDILDKLRD